jgi:hypothetical protein
LSDDNYALRLTYARVSGERPGGTALLTRTRRRIEQDLARALAQQLPWAAGHGRRRSPR